MIQISILAVCRHMSQTVDQQISPLGRLDVEIKHHRSINHALCDRETLSTKYSSRIGIKI